MKRMLKYAVAALSFTLLLPWAFHAQAEGTEEVPPSITVSDVKKTDQGYAFQVKLEGYKGQGDKVILSLYDEAGEVKNETAFEPAASIAMEALGAASKDTAKVAWVNADGSPVCHAAEVKFAYTIQEYSSWNDFADATTELAKEYGYIGAKYGYGSENADEYASARLIVKATGDLPDISAYNPLAVIYDGSSYYIIQLAEADQARECAAYLSGMDGIEYVEPDSTVYAFEDFGDGMDDNMGPM